MIHPKTNTIRATHALKVIRTLIHLTCMVACKQNTYKGYATMVGSHTVKSHLPICMRGGQEELELCLVYSFTFYIHIYQGIHNHNIQSKTILNYSLIYFHILFLSFHVGACYKNTRKGYKFGLTYNNYCQKKFEPCVFLHIFHTYISWNSQP